MLSVAEVVLAAQRQRLRVDASDLLAVGADLVADLVGALASIEIVVVDVVAGAQRGRAFAVEIGDARLSQPAEIHDDRHSIDRHGTPWRAGGIVDACMGRENL